MNIPQKLKLVSQYFLVIHTRKPSLFSFFKFVKETHFYMRYRFQFPIPTILSGM